MKKRTQDQINWANPTSEDLAYLRSLSHEEHSELLKQACDAGIESGVSQRTLEEILQSAEEKATEVA